ncbi:hypothetical protein AABD46_15425 [Vibrio parahaemolyticus]|nr:MULTISPECIES: hypothetical protein [Vibrio]EJG1706450.1 hypothetical protein [Vibrio parahaemolyticus]EKZ9214507.1 hypothetical protein [Vibrio parahaemolyticus]ELA9384216.1 hypothetical protein [Vibrio parahaemolyticus]MBE3700483.1 hypothetical protein [Vibrio parahaemolyticus]MBE3779424.1 hypothetical protein [Vibrio parahaemolyticus]
MPEVRKQFLESLPHTHDSDLIACVGTNGNPSPRHYAFGFLNAAELLLEQQRVKKPYRPKYPVDHMVYPICFNIRHGIEISLKYFLCELEKLYAHRKLSFETPSRNSHNIETIWNDYYQLAIQFDARLDKMAQKLCEYVEPWAEIDATGQTFRYAFSNDAQKHLTEYSTIDLFKVTLNLESLKTHLEDNFALLAELDVEYECSTHTKKLSRWELNKLAKELPLRSEWGEKLVDVKVRWCQKKDLSSREFNQACNLIQSHWEFASHIGLEVPLLGGVTAEDLVWAVEQSMYYHNVILGPTSKVGDDGFIHALLGSNEREIAWLSAQGGETMLERLSPELIATVSSLYYNNRESSYCEDYRVHYEIDCKNLSSDDPNRLIEEFIHLIEKQTFISSIFDSLTLLNQVSIIEKLKAIEGVHAHFDEAAVWKKQSKTEKYHYWYASLPKITKAEEFLSLK